MSRRPNKHELIEMVKSHAAQHPGTEWDFLPKKDEEVSALVGAGRAPRTCIGGVGQKLRVFQGGGFTLAEVAGMSYQRLMEFECNKSRPYPNY
jgi:hypothetical protein